MSVAAELLEIRRCCSKPVTRLELDLEDFLEKQQELRLQLADYLCPDQFVDLVKLFLEVVIVVAFLDPEVRKAEMMKL